MNCLERTFSDTYVIESQECYLLSDININFKAQVKEIFRNKSANNINEEIANFARTHLEFCFAHFLEQIMTRPTRVTDQITTLIDHIHLTKSVNQAS